MKPDRETLLSKVQRLLSLAGSTSENEARVATAKAQAIMLQHNISLMEAEQFQARSGHVVEVVAPNNSGGGPREQTAVLRLVQQFFFVRVIFGPEGIKMLGEPHNIAVANHVYVSLSRTFRQLWKSYRLAQQIRWQDSRAFSSDMLTGKASDFYDGVVVGLATHLRNARRREFASDAQCNALVVRADADLDAAVERHFPAIKPKRIREADDSAECWSAGFDAGTKINIAAAITAAANERPAIEGRG